MSLKNKISQELWEQSMKLLAVVEGFKSIDEVDNLPELPYERIIELREKIKKVRARINKS